MSELQRLLITGASGFLGRHLLDELKERYRIFGLARRSQSLCGAPEHPNITWHQVDICDGEGLAATISRIKKLGGIDTLIHLAAHYDFGHEKNEQYWHTNVDGLRNVLIEARALRPGLLVFASSLAACEFPTPGRVVDETSEASGRHIYARTKREGERLVREYGKDCPSCIVRFAAMFSDWCEYPPMFVSFQTWLSTSWRRRIIGGRGRLAIPYLHVRDAVQFLLRLIEVHDTLEPGEVLLATTDETIPMATLHREVTMLTEGEPTKPIVLPKSLCVAGIHARAAVGRLLGHPPFEQPWMARYIDRQLIVDSSHTRSRLDWAPRNRLRLLRRLPFLVGNMQANPVEWNRRNHAAMRKVQVAINLRICRLLERHDEWIRGETTDRILGQVRERRFPGHEALSRERVSWLVQVALRHLINSIRTRDTTVYLSYCRDLAERSFALGFTVDELCEAQRLLRAMCLRALQSDPKSVDLVADLRRQISMTIMFGCDQMKDSYEQIEHSGGTPTATADRFDRSRTKVGSRRSRGDETKADDSP